MFESATGMDISSADACGRFSVWRASRPHSAALSGASGLERPREHTSSGRPGMQVVPAVTASGRRYRLGQNLILRVTYHADGTVEVRHRSLPVMGIGDTLQEARTDFSEMFDVQYRGLVEESDEEELSTGALAARRELLRYVQATDEGQDAEPCP